MPKPIRLVQMIYNFHLELGGGGITRCAIDLAQNLDPSKFDVSIVGLGHNGTEAEENRIQELNRLGIRAFTTTSWNEKKPYQSFLRSYWFLRSEFERHPVDILHSHSEFTDISAIFLKAERKVPRIMRTTHYGYHSEWRKKPLRRLIYTNFLYPFLYNLEVGVSPTLQARLNRRWIANLLNRDSLFINEAVDIKRFKDVRVPVTEKKLSLGIPSDAPLIGCVGRLAEQKGHVYLLQAAAQVIQNHSHAFFLIIGDGPLSELLKKNAENLGILNQVVFVGSRSDVEELLACLDLFVLASLWEGMPISVLESMASNIPVVATDVPGTRDLIWHGINGLLVPPADPGAMSQAILKLLASPTLSKSLSQAALDTINHYSIESVTARYAALYQY